MRERNCLPTCRRRQSTLAPVDVLAYAATGTTGSPVAVHAAKPPSRSVALTRPSWCRTAAARLDWNPPWQARMIC